MSHAGQRPSWEREFASQAAFYSEVYGQHITFIGTCERSGVERAKALLSQPRLPVIEVESPSAFATTFRRATGLSPQQWRRERLL